MKEIIAIIEQGLGPARLNILKKNEDSFQDFWEGVLKAIPRVDWNKDPVPYLISSGYGQINNVKRSSWSAEKFRFCPNCGQVYGYRTKICVVCGNELESSNRHSEYEDYHEGTKGPDQELAMDIELFVDTLIGNEKYTAKRWMIDRADLRYQNYSKQIAFELNISAPRVSQIIGKIKQKFQGYINR